MNSAPFFYRQFRFATASAGMARAAVLSLAVVLAGCASSETARDPAVNDPYESFNRGVFAFNEAVDTAVLRPVAQGYRAAVPDPVRERVRNGLRNLNSPVIFANLLLQGEWKGATDTFIRFVFNSTFGLAGLHDIAALAGLPYRQEDFGQTMAVYGTPEGPYLMLPLLGPSNPRDAFGRIVDWAADPVRIYATQQDDGDIFNMSRGVIGVIDTREALLDPLDEVKKSSLDYYAALRSLYRQRRDAQISNTGTGLGDAQQIDGAEFDAPADENAK